MVEVTDASNAARTLLYDIHRRCWDDDLLHMLDIPRVMLPDVRSSSEVYARTAPSQFFGASVPIAGVAGDQQAATVGQGCFAPGMMKSTYGTGCFALLNTGSTPVASRARMLTTIRAAVEGRRRTHLADLSKTEIGRARIGLLSKKRLRSSASASADG